MISLENQEEKINSNSKENLNKLINIFSLEKKKTLTNEKFKIFILLANGLLRFEGLREQVQEFNEKSISNGNPTIMPDGNN